MNHRTSLTKWIWKTIRPHRKHLALVASLALFDAAFANVIPLFWRKVVNDAVAGNTNWTIIFGFCVFIIVSEMPIFTVQNELLAHRYRHTVSRLVLHWVLGLSPEWHRRQRAKVLIEKMKKGSTATLRAIQTLLAGEILIEIGAAAIAVVVIGNYSLTAVIIILGFTIGYIMVNRYLGRKLSRQEEIVEKADQELRARVHEALENIEAIRYHHATDREREWNYQLSQTTTNEHIKSAWLESWSNLFARLSNMLPFIVAAVVFIPMLERRVVDVGTFFMLLMYGQRIVSPFHAVSRIWMDLKKDEPRIRALLQILAVQPTVTESPEAREMQPLQRSIIFRDVAFRYPENQEPIINIRHLEILARQTTALIGETGKAGKTTIANLLTRLFDVERGSITFDDTDVRDLSFSSLYRQVYYVAQHPRVFSGTIWDLLTYGLNQQEITREDVIDACRRAKADFVFDRGFAAEVGENAGNLSGGERQRLMLARIFLRRPSVVILDEPTSALDQETERFVIESLDKLRAENPDMTFIVIAHRLRTIEKADYIVCLEHGRVHATGTHQELLETSTVYRQLCGLELPD